MNYRDYPTVKPSDNRQMLNRDSEYLRFEREDAIRGKIALAFWAILAIAGFALLYKAFM